MKDMSTVALGNLVSVSEAAERLGLDEDSVTRYCRLGRLRAQQKGRMWLIDEECLETFQPRPRGNPNFSSKSS